jgi:hypothetical protein
MLKVGVWYHKDGDHLAIVEVPWWTNIFENAIVNRFCPCCGVSGWICGKSEKIEAIYYRIWNRLLNFSYSREKELFSIPVENACVVSHAIWPKRKDACFRDGCENCWHLGEDAFQYEAK